MGVEQLFEEIESFCFVFSCV